jgi:hypothetical protein
MFESFMNWFNLDAYGSINVLESDTNLRFRRSEDEAFSILIAGKICIRAQYQYHAQTVTYVKRHITVSKIGLGTREVMDCSYSTQGELYTNLVLCLKYAWRNV